MLPFALKFLVAVALYDAIEATLPPTSTVKVEHISPMAVFNSLRLAPNGLTIGYSSSLPLSWGQASSRASAAAMTQLLQHLQQHQPLNLDSGSGIAGPIWQQMQIKGLPSGQWQLGLQRAGVTLWLQYWNLTSTQTLMSAVDRVPNLDLNQALMSPAQLAQRLQLHPLVVIQYVYARCFQMSQSGSPPGASPGSSASPDDGESRALAVAQGAGWEEPTKAALLTLIHLVDHLADARTAPRRLLRLGYQLAESTDLWLASLPAQDSLYGEHRQLLLGIRRALRILLTVKFEYPLPKAL